MGKQGHVTTSSTTPTIAMTRARVIASSRRARRADDRPFARDREFIVKNYVDFFCRFTRETRRREAS